MTFEVVTFVNGRWKQNCYLIGSATGDALIVDPGSDHEGIQARLADLGWSPCGILNTHAHYDHIGAVEALKNRYGIPFYLHQADLDLLRRANLYRLIFDSREVVQIPEVDHDLSQVAGRLSLGGFDISVIHTPGHTDGGTCFLLEGYLFSGDTLMAEGGGRTDLPGGNREVLTKSHRQLSKLDGDLLVFGGHGGQVTLMDALAAAAAQEMESVE